jgi:hypothetical protein
MARAAAAESDAPGADDAAPTMKDAAANTANAPGDAPGATEPTGANGANGTASADGSSSNKSASDKTKSTASNGGSGGSGSSAPSGSARDAAHGDGTLSVTPDSPADSEWRQRRGPLDAAEGGPWASEDAAGACELFTSFFLRGASSRRRRRRCGVGDDAGRRTDLVSGWNGSGFRCGVTCVWVYSVVKFEMHHFSRESARIE